MTLYNESDKVVVEGSDAVRRINLFVFRFIYT
jgi:hypothetical protein